MKKIVFTIICLLMLSGCATRHSVTVGDTMFHTGASIGKTTLQ